MLKDPLVFKIDEIAGAAYEEQSSAREPATFDEAMRGPDKEKWQQAMQEEIDSLKRMGTWKLVEPPEGRKIVGCKWVFKIKYNADGSIARCKARLVAQGFSQIEGVDYTETFAPVARYTSFRVVLTLSTKD